MKQIYGRFRSVKAHLLPLYVKIHHSAMFGKLIPEFVVIALGVAVGLAVDSWREDYKQHKLRGEYIDLLVSTIAADTVTLRDEINRVIERDSCAKRLLNVACHNSADSVDTRTLLLATQLIAPPINFSVYDDLVATGNINVFTDLRQKQAIITYYENMRSIIGWIKDSRARKGQDDILPIQVFEENMGEVEQILKRTGYQPVNINRQIQNNSAMIAYLNEAVLYCLLLHPVLNEWMLPPSKEIIHTIKHK